MTKFNNLKMDDRVPTGIDGLDSLLNGGIPRGNVVLVSGASGTGKTMIAAGFIYHGAQKYGENGVYISLEEFPDRFIDNAKKIGLIDIEELIEQKKMLVVRTDVFDIEKLVGSIEDLLDQYDAKRVVIDSISVLSAFSEQPFKVRKTIYEISNMFKRMGVTAIFTGGIGDTGEGNFGISVEEYAADGVIRLFHKLVGTQFIRAIGVIKMRGTNHSDSLHPVGISAGGGISVLQDLPLPDNFKA